MPHNSNIETPTKQNLKLAMTQTLAKLHAWQMLAERDLKSDLDDMLTVPAVAEEAFVAVQGLVGLERLVNKVRTEALLFKFYLQLQLFPYECKIRMQRPYGKNDFRQYFHELRSAQHPHLAFDARAQASPCLTCSAAMNTVFGVSMNDALAAGWSTLNRGLDMENWIALKNTVLEGEEWCGPLPMIGQLNGEQHTYWALGYGAPVVLGKQVTQWTLQLHDVSAVQQLFHDRVQVAFVIQETKTLLKSLDAFIKQVGPVFHLDGATPRYTNHELEITREDLLKNKALQS